MEKPILERISSPEDLDRRLVVVSSKGWVALALTSLLIVGAIFWAFYGLIPNAYETKTIFLNNLAKPGEYDFFSFIRIEHGQQIKKGMRVYIQPEGVDVQQYGSLEAVVASISPHVASDEELKKLLVNPHLIDYFTGNHPVFIATIEPQKNLHTTSGFTWTSGFGPPSKISLQTTGTALIVLQSRPPISYVIPIWRAKKVIYDVKEH